MSLTKQDLTDIREVVLDALDVVVNPRLDLLETEMSGQKLAQHETNRRLSSVETRLAKVEGSVTALHNDVVEIYGMVR